MGRAPCCDKASVKKGPWSPEEDAKLKAYIEKYGTGGNWIALPQKIGLKRCGKSCRLRWLNYLRPNIKHGGFSEEEDNIICSLYISIGSRWSIIAAQLPGRTDNDIKNYWNTRLKKKLLGRHKQSQMINPSSAASKDLKDTNGVESPYAPALSSSALERLQLHMQLQSLQDPLSFYSDPAPSPKLHHLLHEKMTPSLQFSSHSPNPMVQRVQSRPRPGDHGQRVELYEPPTGSAGLQQDYFINVNLKVSELESYLTGSSAENSMAYHLGNSQIDATIAPKSGGEEQAKAKTQPASTFEAELDDFLNSKTVEFLPQEDQMAELDCFEEMDGSKDSMVWWSDDLDMQFAPSSSSWDSTTSALHHQPRQGLCQDYMLGYNVQ